MGYRSDLFGIWASITPDLLCACLSGGRLQNRSDYHFFRKLRYSKKVHFISPRMILSRNNLCSSFVSLPSLYSRSASANLSSVASSDSLIHFGIFWFQNGHRLQNDMHAFWGKARISTTGCVYTPSDEPACQNVGCHSPNLGPTQVSRFPFDSHPL